MDAQVMWDRISQRWKTRRMRSHNALRNQSVLPDCFSPREGWLSDALIDVQVMAFQLTEIVQTDLADDSRCGVMEQLAVFSSLAGIASQYHIRRCTNGSLGDEGRLVCMADGRRYFLDPVVDQLLLGEHPSFWSLFVPGLQVAADEPITPPNQGVVYADLYARLGTEEFDWVGSPVPHRHTISGSERVIGWWPLIAECLQVALLPSSQWHLCMALSARQTLMLCQRHGLDMTLCGHWAMECALMASRMSVDHYGEVVNATIVDSFPVAG